MIPEIRINNIRVGNVGIGDLPQVGDSDVQSVDICVNDIISKSSPFQKKNTITLLNLITKFSDFYYLKRIFHFLFFYYSLFWFVLFLL